MPRWIGLLGSWALLVLGLAVASVAIAAEYINIKEARRFARFEKIDALIDERGAGTLNTLRDEIASRTTSVDALQTKIAGVSRSMDEQQDTDQTILVSTAENKVYVKRGGQTVFEAIASTGKGTTLIHNGRAMVFNTPIGKFKVISKEENPVWVPPDWHYVEEARKRGLRVVRLERGQSIDAVSGNIRPRRDKGVWAWFGGDSDRVLEVQGKDVVEVSGGGNRPLPAGEMITVGDALVIPPLGTKQRQFEKVLGSYRLNLGDGYALHGTQSTSQLGRSVSHGCVRLGDADIAQLYQMANAGDEVIIY
jgi:lipoprotein-anchoring transpeptidase ErfK/SrfK